MVSVIGAGKLGTALARALRAKDVKVTLRAARKGLPRAIDADIVVLAVRDRDLRPLAERMVGVVAPRAVVVHVAGALGAEALAPLRGACAGIAQMHPMISFASTRTTPSLVRGNVLLQGDAAAVTRARRLARLLGMTPRTVPGLDAVAYHAAAGLVANGAAALAAVGAELLIRAGVPRDVAPEVNRLEGAFVYDIDDLQSVTASHLSERSREAMQAEAIVQAEVERFANGQQTLSAVPAIDQSSTGRRPTRSETRPHTGTKRNCISE